MNKPDIVVDKRRFFRIDDTVNLYYKVVDEQAVVAASKTTDDLLSNCSLVTALDVLDQECRLIMHRIEKKEPEIAEYLKIVDSKVSLLAQSVMRQDHDLTESEMCNTNISASGLAIEMDHTIEEGIFLEIKLLLTSCIAVIIIYGRVIYCKDNRENNPHKPYLVGVDYVNLNDQDREILIKHIVKRQMQQVRENKGR